MYPLFAFVRCAKNPTATAAATNKHGLQNCRARKLSTKKNSNSNNNNSYNAAPVNPKYNGSCRKNLTFFVGFPMTTRESILKFSKYSNLMAKNGTKLLKNNPRLTLAVQKSLLKTGKSHKRASFIIYSIQ